MCLFKPNGPARYCVNSDKEEESLGTALVGCLVALHRYNAPQHYSVPLALSVCGLSFKSCFFCTCRSSRGVGKRASGCFSHVPFPRFVENFSLTLLPTLCL